MIKIVNVNEFSGGVEVASKYVHGKWGNQTNYLFYYDSILHSSIDSKALPRFFLLLKEKEIIGCYGLLTNDLVSRQDLLPWFACLFIEENERGQNFGKLLLEHAEQECSHIGISSFYLTTEHDGYYEKYGWQRIEDGYFSSGKKIRIYKKEINKLLSG